MAKQPGGLRVLVVENDELFREVLEDTLIVLGHEIVGRASTATGAVAEAERKLPDLVLMDVRLDGPGDGVDAAYAIKNRLGIRSLFLTGTTDSATRARAVMAGPIGYLEKPVAIRELATALARARGDAGRSYVAPPNDVMRVSTAVSFGHSEAKPLDWRSGAMTIDMSAKERREMAARARRLVQGLIFDVDRERLLEYADELERQADALERQRDHQKSAASAVPRPDVGREQRHHSQEQQQQQSGAPSDNAQGARRTATD